MQNTWLLKSRKFKRFVICLSVGVFLSGCGQNIESQDFSDLSSTVKKKMKSTIKLAKDDDKDAQLLLSHMYLGRMQNEDYPLDQEKGVYWLEKFSEGQHPLILEQTATMFHYGDYGVKKDLNNAFKWYKKAADKGSVAAMDTVGIFYSQGYGDIEQNCAQAVEWYEKSLAGGNRLSGNNIAWEYATCQLDSFRNGKKALGYALDVVDQDGNDDYRHLDTLAAAYAENNNFESAIKTQREALGLVDKEKSPKLFEEFLQRLKMYKQGEKWRNPETVSTTEFE